MNRRLSTLTGQPRQLDGGVMFGAVPRQLWASWIAPDHNNQIGLASRALLVQQDRQNILVLAGSEGLLAPLPRACSCQHYAAGLLDSLAEHGLGEMDIHAVVLTHLQARLSPELQAAVRAGDMPRLLFPRARYLVGERHWIRASHPHPLDRALFVQPIIGQLESSGRLALVEGTSSELLGPGWHFQVSDGYTPGQLLPEIDMPGGKVVFAGDLLPGSHWLRLDVTSALDRNPECLVEEKERLLDHLVAIRGRLVLARDPAVAMVKICRDRQSRYQPFDHHTELRRLDS
ncbi:MBL fold metallo-hydrolase [Pseudomonas sp. LS44]|uniref:MBL fold metallo-hydrolase n=1 Tax=Pseudomonas sp. LS44 TaxID=1357074 RepID=UPI00215A5FED|nr:MBL fold metallo-hydrolase [Pseudomonas sp. LS44]UVE19545.1 MBL fold metallo-hydrolase [Pseudomonas sp. LS44]